MSDADFISLAYGATALLLLLLCGRTLLYARRVARGLAAAKASDPAP